MYILAGGSGIPNFGDEIIARNWVSFIRARDPEAGILLDCKSPEASEEIVGARPGLSHASYLRRLSRGRVELTFWGSVKRGYEFIRKGGFERHRGAEPFAEAIQAAKVFHIFGGGYINERWPTSGFLIGFAASLSELYGTRIAATGLGLMPLAPPPSWSTIGLFNRILAHFDHFDVRDTPSWQAVSSAPGLRSLAGLDDSFLVPAAGRSAGPATLHLAVSFGAGNAAKLADIVRHAGTVLAAPFERVLFWRCAPGKDEMALAAFREICPRLEVAEVYDLVNEPLPIGPDDAMVTTRFHPHLLAARLGIPGYYFVDSAYYQVKHGSVVDLGSGFRPIVPGDRPEGFGGRSGRMAAREAERVAAKQRLAGEIYRAAAPAARCLLEPAQ